MNLTQAFILLVLVIGNDGNSTTSQRFESKGACLAAKEWVIGSQNSSRTWVKAECFGESVPVQLPEDRG